MPTDCCSYDPSTPSTPRSQHITRTPAHLSDYHCYLSQHEESLYPLSHYLSYDRLSYDYKPFILNISMTNEPASYHEATKFPH